MTELDDDRSPANIVAALKDLIQSDGWKLFVAQLEHEWGPAGFGREVQRVTAAIPPGQENAYEIADAVKRVQMTAKAVNDLVKWPEEQIRALSDPRVDRRPFAALRRSR